MRVCVVGAGIAGLSVALYLSAGPDVEITVVEQSSIVGGRANVEQGAEHCPRVFLNDYKYLFDILRSIPGPDGGSVYDRLSPLRRMVRVGGTWVEVSHLYRILAREVPLRERLKQAIAGRRSPLVAEQNVGPNTNRYGSLRNYSLGSLVRLVLSLLRSKTGKVLIGPTDQCLTRPWVRHLEARGVSVRTGQRVDRLHPYAHSVDVTINGRVERFDAVVVTAFLPDVRRLLDESELEHTLPDPQHVHCKALTIVLDPAEQIMTDSAVPAIYCHDGINIVVQPRYHRCVVLCTWSKSTDTDFVVAQVRGMLGLEHDVLSVRVRDNQLPREGVLAADYVAPQRILRRPYASLYFAGSYVSNSYPVDSGEGAVRSAYNAVARLREQHGLRLAAAVPERLAR